MLISRIPCKFVRVDEPWVPMPIPAFFTNPLPPPLPRGRAALRLWYPVLAQATLATGEAGSDLLMGTDVTSESTVWPGRLAGKMLRLNRHHAMMAV